MDLSAIDVQQKTFRERFRGYDPDDVEDFLDRVVETLRGYELKLRQQQESVDALQQDLAGTKEAEEAIKRTYITAQRTSQEMVSEAQSKANSIVDRAKNEAEATVSEARAEVKRTREEATAEHDALKRRVTQLRSAVGDLQTRLQAFAETAAVDLEGLGGSIDLETHSISEILEKAAGEQDQKREAHPAGSGKAKPRPSAENEEEPVSAGETVTEEGETVIEDGADSAHEAAYLQQPRGQRPWERA
ncbi:MAG: DivIVA domain-containing protein [Acidimicrobiia bacterium]|nr:DivIVA domain-containing protein [Acidimicrobiia bacterium]